MDAASLHNILFHEAPVYHNPFVYNQRLLIQKLEEQVEQIVENIFLDQLLTEDPYRFFVGYLVAAGESEETAKREPVTNLIFCLFVAEIVHPLKHQHLEHQHVVVRLRTHIVFAGIFACKTLEIS